MGFYFAGPIRAATRSFALRLRGLRFISSAVGVIGFRVNTVSVGS